MTKRIDGADRAARLKAALRENLKRRKTQSRSRAVEDSPSAPDESGDDRAADRDEPGQEQTSDP